MVGMNCYKIRPRLLQNEGLTAFVTISDTIVGCVNLLVINQIMMLIYREPLFNICFGIELLFGGFLNYLCVVIDS